MRWFTGSKRLAARLCKTALDELVTVIERIPTNLRHEERLQREAEIEQLHQDMEQVRHRVEASIERMEAACEQNVTQLAEFIETLQQRLPALPKESRDTTHMSQLNQLLSQGKSSLATKDYEACMAMMQEVLQMAPENPEAVTCLEEAQRKLEDQRLEEELVIHIDNLKKEATDLFDQEKYRECAGLFKFLCELEPKNRRLQDYLELSQEKVKEIEETEAAARLELQSQVYPAVEPPSHPVENSDATNPNPPVTGFRGEPVDADAKRLSSGTRTGFKEDAREEDEDSRPGTSLAVVFGVVAVLALILAGALLLRGFKASSAGSVESEHRTLRCCCPGRRAAARRDAVAVGFSGGRATHVDLDEGRVCSGVTGLHGFIRTAIVTCSAASAVGPCACCQGTAGTGSRCVV